MKRILLALPLALSLALGLALAPAAAQDAPPEPAPPVTATATGAVDKDIAEQAAEVSAEVEDDKGFITRFLERNLSGAGRQVIITGFQGALSSRATFTEMTIADADGVWITLKNGAIQWDRSALFARRIDITELSAAEILLPRLPDSGEPQRKAEVRDFALPTLPVAVNIARIKADRVDIGAPVIGETVAEVAPGMIRTASGKTVRADLTVWAAGIKAPAILSELDGLPVNRLGQLIVRRTLQTEIDDNIFALGDCAACPWPGNERNVPPHVRAARMADHPNGPSVAT